MHSLVSMGETEASKTVNFVLLHPTSRAISYDPGKLTVKLEQPPFALHSDPNRAVWSDWSGMHAYSTVANFQTTFGILRCKQYLYDLGPLSALDHAALFDCKPQLIRAHQLDSQRIAWTGFDYRHRRALSMLAWGTNIELRELRGTHSPGFMVELAKSFKPVMNRPLGPFANRSYWSKYPRYDLHLCRDLYHYRPPSSLWLWRWPWLAVNHQWATTVTCTNLRTFCQNASDALAPDWRFDSACLFGEPQNPAELQLLFEPACALGHSRLWFRRFPQYLGAIPRPNTGEWPQLDNFSGFQPFKRLRLSTRTRIQVYVASHRVEFGPHDALWWDGEYGYLLQVSSAAPHSIRNFLDTLRKILGTSSVESRLT